MIILDVDELCKCVDDNSKYIENNKVELLESI